MKTLLATAFTALALATPAQAEQLSPHLRAEARAWGTAFRQAGVSFVSSESCEPDLSAYYEPGNRTITICESNVETVDDYREAVAHEAIHAAQHCVGRRLGVDDMLPLHTMLAEKDPEIAYKWQLAVNKAAARKGDLLAQSREFNSRGITAPLEREAYALESDSAAALKIFRAACLKTAV